MLAIPPTPRFTSTSLFTSSDSCGTIPPSPPGGSTTVTMVLGPYEGFSDDEIDVGGWFDAIFGVDDPYGLPGPLTWYDVALPTIIPSWTTGSLPTAVSDPAPEPIPAPEISPTVVVVEPESSTESRATVFGDGAVEARPVIQESTEVAGYEIPPFEDSVEWIPSEPVEAGEDEGVTQVAIDWGNVVDFGIDLGSSWLQTGSVLPGIQQNLSGPAPTVPTTVTVDTRTGKVTPCKRRRRRRLLTSSDLQDLAALATIVGKGDALKMAVAKAVRR